MVAVDFQNDDRLFSIKPLAYNDVMNGLSFSNIVSKLHDARDLAHIDACHSNEGWSHCQVLFA